MMARVQKLSKSEKCALLQMSLAFHTGEKCRQIPQRLFTVLLVNPICWFSLYTVLHGYNFLNEI